MKLGVRVGLGPGHILVDVDPTPPPAKGHSAPFSAHICCDQMAAWIKIPLGREIGFGPSDIVLDGRTQFPFPKNEAEPPIFGPYLLWPAKRLHGSRCHLVWRYASAEATLLDGDPALPPPKKRKHSPRFLAHVFCGQMVAHLSYCCALVQTVAPKIIPVYRSAQHISITVFL